MAALLAVVWACCALSAYPALATETSGLKIAHRHGPLHVARLATGAPTAPPPSTPLITWWQNRPIVATRGHLVLHNGNCTEKLPPLPSPSHITALYTQDDTLYVGHSDGVHILPLRHRHWRSSLSVKNVTALGSVPETKLLAIAAQALGVCSPICSWDVHGGLLRPLGSLRAGSISALSANASHLWAVGDLHLPTGPRHVSVYTRGQWHAVPDKALPCAPHAVAAYGPFVATACSDTRLFRYDDHFVPVSVPNDTHITHLFGYAGESDDEVVLATGALPHALGTAPFAQLRQGAWHELATYVGPPKARPVLGVGSVVGVSLAMGLGTTFALLALSVAATLLLQALRLALPPLSRS
ncbi:hypothetical protein MNAN1_001342 [Malassezia nana]|uniref:Uncharacterized protein n=1 Tax=Malassezia nana TaxID=180528 RepID=A0AAF0J351_9BASI|nr:hypothetical protein MNAN1_001342 [Malassezia nana]